MAGNLPDQRLLASHEVLYSMDRFIFGLVKVPVSISDSTAFNSV